MSRGIRYTAAEEVEPKLWEFQGTVYSDIHGAKMAAAKLYASLLNDGVIVKRCKGGWTCFWWRKV